MCIRDRHDVDPFDVVSVGDVIEALVQTKEDKEGRLILSKKRAQYERAWGTIEKVKEEDGVVTGRVIEVVKGGLIIDIGLRGFLPASLVEMRRVRDLQPYEMCIRDRCSTPSTSATSRWTDSRPTTSSPPLPARPPRPVCAS